MTSHPVIGQVGTTVEFCSLCWDLTGHRVKELRPTTLVAGFSVWSRAAIGHVAECTECRTSIPTHAREHLGREDDLSDLLHLMEFSNPGLLDEVQQDLELAHRVRSQATLTDADRVLAASLSIQRVLPELDRSHRPGIDPSDSRRLVAMLLFPIVIAPFVPTGDQHLSPPLTVALLLVLLVSMTSPFLFAYRTATYSRRIRRRKVIVPLARSLARWRASEPEIVNAISALQASGAFGSDLLTPRKLLQAMEKHWDGGFDAPRYIHDLRWDPQSHRPSGRGHALAAEPLPSLQLNPYQEATASGEHTAWREGRNLVAFASIVLPRRCAVCNQPAVGPPLVKELTTVPVWSLLLLFLGPFTMLFPVGRSAQLSFGLCQEHGERTRRASGRTTFLLSIGLAAFLGLQFVALQIKQLYLPALGVLFLGTLTGVVLVRRGTLKVQALRMRGGLVWVRGCGSAFLESLPSDSHPRSTSRPQKSDSEESTHGQRHKPLSLSR